jgi:hypothetical protein
MRKSVFQIALNIVVFQLAKAVAQRLRRPNVTVNNIYTQ